MRDVDVFEDLAAEGRLEIWIQCSDSGQYFGMAPADVYILEADAPFWWNFVKGYMGIWLQMLLVTTFGVMFSTFLSGAVAMMATLSCDRRRVLRQVHRGRGHGFDRGRRPDRVADSAVDPANLSVRYGDRLLATRIVQASGRRVHAADGGDGQHPAELRELQHGSLGGVRLQH